MATTMMLEQARAHLQQAQRIAVLTGAGISAESGIPTFRGAQGLWRNHRPEDLASPAAYARDPAMIWEWYLWRLEKVLHAQPNEAHYALVQLAQNKQLTLVTQNVDGLHTRAGSQAVLELHGNMTQSRCESCGNLDAIPHALLLEQRTIPHCSQCSQRARPNVVWFGENLPAAVLEHASEAFYHCDVALVIGTSGVVQPAASLALLAQDAGAVVIEINLEPTPLTARLDYALQTTASAGMRQLMAPPFIL